MTLPPIALVDLPERTKDFLIALGNRDNVTVAEAMKRVLSASASRAGFLSLPTSPEGAGNVAHAA